MPLRLYAVPATVRATVPATDYATDAATDPTTGQIKRNAGLMQAYALRQLTFDLAREVGLSSDSELTDELRTRANAVTGLVRAWAEADERARIARGRPLPGSLRPERKPSKPKRTAAPITMPAPVSTTVETASAHVIEQAPASDASNTSKQTSSNPVKDSLEPSDAKAKETPSEAQ